MAEYGGLFRFTYDGNALTIRGSLDAEPADFSYTVEHNQDGSFDRMIQPMGPTAEATFRDSADADSAISQPWNAIMKGGPYNISILGDTIGVTLQYTNAKFIGRPKVDWLKGTVTGLSIQSPTGGYKQLRA